MVRGEKDRRFYYKVGDRKSRIKAKKRAESYSKDTKVIEIDENTTTYDLIKLVKSKPKKQIYLPKPNKVVKIGKFVVKYQLNIGEFDYTPIKMKKGNYTAYKAGDNLIVIHDSYKNKVSKSTIPKWKWKYSGKGVGVDGGTFGFVDIKLKSQISDSEISPPGLYKDGKDYILWSGYHPEMKKKIDFGVVMSTGTGDGGFECYQINDTIAVLVGGFTAEQLYH